MLLKPPAPQPVLDQNGAPSLAWLQFFHDLANALSDYEAKIAVLEARLAAASIP